MKKTYTSIFHIFLLMTFFAFTAQAQITCDSVGVIIDDSFEDYEEGALGPQADHWTTWSGTEGGNEDGIVNQEFANSGLQSFKIEGESDGGPQDVLLNLGDKTTGTYLLEWQMYIIETLGAYFNIQHFEGDPGGEFAIEVDLEPNGKGKLFAGSSTAREFDYPVNTWFKVRFIIDMDADLAYMYIDKDMVYSWPISWVADEQTGTKQLGAIDFYPLNDEYWFYVDDVYYAEIPSPAGNSYCHLATGIDVGTHTVGDLECYGAGFTIRSAGQGQAGAWYSYTPAEDGVITVSSCGAGNDSRVWVFSGGCETLVVAGVNDDMCEINTPGEQEWASYTEVLVTAGETYLICWDNIWDGGNFDFSLEFTTEAPADGNFCEYAIAVEPGTHTIDVIDGHGNVSGPNINHTGASTTNYAQSEWYSYTPTDDGLMTVQNCGLTAEDTRLWIYEGECGIETIQLIASNDDACELQSQLLEIPVTAGTTYYIEWDDESLNAPGFDWELIFDVIEDVEESEFKSTFELSPNPASDAVFITFDLPETSNLSIDLISNTGKLLQNKQVDNMSNGTIEFDTSELPAGLYFVQVRDDRNAVTRRFIVK